MSLTANSKTDCQAQGQWHRWLQVLICCLYSCLPLKSQERMSGVLEAVGAER